MGSIKIPTAELSGAALDWAVAAALEIHFKEERVVKVCRAEATTPAWIEVENSPGSSPYFHRFSPSTDRNAGDPIIEREQISIARCNDLYFPNGNEHGEIYEEYWKATPLSGKPIYGPTPTIAAMRCYVASKLGNEVEVPDSLTQ